MEKNSSSEKNRNPFGSGENENFLNSLESKPGEIFIDQKELENMVSRFSIEARLASGESFDATPEQKIKMAWSSLMFAAQDIFDAANGGNMTARYWFLFWQRYNQTLMKYFQDAYEIDDALMGKIAREGLTAPCHVDQVKRIAQNIFTEVKNDLAEEGWYPPRKQNI
jgi:hypothetical protein